MDLATVLEIKTLIAIRLDNELRNYCDTELFCIAGGYRSSEIRQVRAEYESSVKLLKELDEQLQSFIDAQLNAVENQTGE